MSQASTANVVQLFKKVYGDLNDLQSEDYKTQADIPFAEGQKVGESYVEAVVLTSETGWSILGSTSDINELNPAIAGAVRQVEVRPYETVLASVVPWGVISRSAGGGQKAFYAATRHIVKNNLKSHGKLLEILRIYGQCDQLLGYVSYFTGNYRGQAFTAGSGTLNGVTFTNGVSVASKAILFAPGNFASGIWVGTERAQIQQVDASGNVLASGKLVRVEADFGYLVVDFVPVAATTTTSTRICFVGQAEKRDAPGIVNILSTTGTLFGVSTQEFSLWKGNVYPVGNKRLTLLAIYEAIALAVNRGSLDGDIDLYVNPRTWAQLLGEQTAFRRFDSSYKTSNLDNGAEALTFYSQAGVIRIKSHRFIMEGMAIGLHLDDWSRSGSAEISFRVPGSNQDLIFPLQNATAWAFRSYSDQYVFCNAPARSILFTGINDEVAA